MKKITAAILILLTVLALLTACEIGGNGKTTTGASTTAKAPVTTEASATTTEGQTTTAQPVVTTAAPVITTEEKEEYEDYLILSKNGFSDYKIIDATAVSTGQYTAIQNFQSFFQNKSKSSYKLPIYSENAKPSAKEIAVSVTNLRENSAKALAETPYTGFDVRVDGEAILVSAYTDKQLKNAFGFLEEQIVYLDKDKTLLGIRKDFSHRSEGGAGGTVPKFETSAGYFQGGSIYEEMNGSTMISFAKAGAAEFDAYVKKVAASGFTKYAENSINGNSFYTFRDDKINLHLGYYPLKKVLTVVFEPNTNYLPVNQTSYTKTNEVSITQLGRSGAEDTAPGMGFILQLEDGRFIVMDGGTGHIEDEINLYNTLTAMKPAAHEKPIVAMWMLSHADGDHTQLATEFMRSYKDKVTVEMIALNAPDFTRISMAKVDPAGMNNNLSGFINAARTNNKDVIYWQFHTGQKMEIGGVTVEPIFTHEEMYPNAMPYGNHTCSAWRFMIHGTQAVFLGDCETQLCQWMADVFNTEIKCDILQASHHGFNGAVNAIYQKTDPKVVLWPVDYTRWSTDKRCIGTQSGYAFNAILRSQQWTRGGESGNRQHFAASTTTVITFAQDGSYTLSRTSD